MSNNNNNNAEGGCGIFSFLGGVATAMVGYTIHGSIFWSIVDFFFVPIVWIKWFACREINWAIIQQTFPWFF